MNTPGTVLHPTASTQLEAFLNAPAHAVLLAGPEGIGKTHIAAVLATELLGATTLENNAYYREVVSEKNSIAIEQIRNLVSFFRLKVPGPAKIKRVAVIQDADEMGLEAQNALLKLLEEPPADSVLMLTSSHSQQLLPTVRSRMQTLQLASPIGKDLEQHFTALGYEATAITAALLRASTNVAEATRLLSGDSGSKNTTIDLVKQVLGGNTYDRLLLVDTLTKQKGLAPEFVATLGVVAAASLEATARRGAPVDRWKTVLQAAHVAEDALARSGNTKLVLTELMVVI